MEIQLMDLSGDSIGALAAARALEKEQIDPTLHALYDEIAAKRGRNDVVEMLLAIDGKAAPLAGRQYPFAQPFGALQGFPHGGLGEMGAWQAKGRG